MESIKIKISVCVHVVITMWYIICYFCLLVMYVLVMMAVWNLILCVCFLVSSMCVFVWEHFLAVWKGIKYGWCVCVLISKICMFVDSVRGGNYNVSVYLLIIIGSMIICWNYSSKDDENIVTKDGVQK
jgi:hypothetical protein